MNVYYIETSKRKGYTYEKPTMDFCIEYGEILMNTYNFGKPILNGPHSTTLYKVFYVQDSRGDIEEVDAHYFLDEPSANAYLQTVKDIRRNKMISGYKLSTYPIYDSLLDLPLKNTFKEASPEDLYWQERSHREAGLTLEEKLAAYISERVLL